MNTENTGNQSNNKSAIVMLDDLRNKLKAGDATIGAWQMTGDVNTTCVMASLGFDWIVVDLEHSMIDLGRVESIFIAAERYDVVPLVRLPNMDPYFYMGLAAWAEPFSISLVGISPHTINRATALKNNTGIGGMT